MNSNVRANFLYDNVKRVAVYYDDMEQAILKLENNQYWFNKSSNHTCIKHETSRAYSKNSLIYRHEYTSIYSPSFKNLLNVEFIDDLIYMKSLLKRRARLIQEGCKLDLHGYKSWNVVGETIRFFSSSINHNMPFVTIIHGHNQGTAIRKVLWDAIAARMFKDYIPICDDKNLIEKLNRFNFDDLKCISFDARDHPHKFYFYAGSIEIPLNVVDDKIWAFNRLPNRNKAKKRL